MVYYTDGQDQTVYAIATQKYPYPKLQLKAPIASASTEVSLLGYGKVSFSSSGGIMTINVPLIPFDEMPCQYAYVFKITNVKN